MSLPSGRRLRCPRALSRQTGRDRQLLMLDPLARAVSLALCGAVLMLTNAGVSQAQTATGEAAQAPAMAFRISAGPLAPALRSLAASANLLLTFTEAQAAGHTTSGIEGHFTPQVALARLLAGTGLQAVAVPGGGYVLQSVGESGAATKSGVSETMAPVRITGSIEQGTDLPRPFAGGLVARGARVGILGNRDVLDTPFNTTSYTVDAIQNQQSTSVMSVLRADPSVRSVFPDGGLGQYFNVRGYYTQSHELAWNGLYGLVPHNRTSTEFLERVEVLKGPGALLYGMSLGGAVGGVVNLVPKRAGAQPLTRLTTTYTSDSNLGAHIDVGRRFGKDRAFGIRVNALRSHGDLMIDGQTEGRTVGSLALDFEHERVRAALDLYSTDEKQRGGAPMMTGFAAGVRPEPPDPTRSQIPGAYTNSRAKGAIGSVEVELAEDWQVYAKGGVKQQKGSGYLNNLIGTNARADGSFTARSFNINNYFNTQSAETGVRGRLTTGPVRHDLVLSSTYVTQETGAVANTIEWPSNLYAPGTPTFAAEPDRRKTASTTLNSFALADTLSFDDKRYQLTLGLRHQRVRTRGFNPAGAVTTAYDEAAVTPAIGLVLRPWSVPLSVYANRIEGLSEGGSVTDVAAANFGEVFRPYKTKQTEVGVKWDFGQMLSTLSLFSIERPSLIRNATTNVYALEGQQRNRGIEWTIAGQPATGLRVFGGASYIQAVTTRTVGGLLDGNQVMGVPKWYANLTTEWDLPGLSALTLTGAVLHTGPQFINAANTQNIPSWTRADVGLRYATRIASHPTVLRVNVFNVFDRRYWEGVYFGSVSVGAARTLRASLQVDF